MSITIPPGETSLNIPEMPDVTRQEEAGLKAGRYRVIVWGKATPIPTLSKIPEQPDTLSRCNGREYRLRVRRGSMRRLETLRIEAWALWVSARIPRLATP